MKEKIAKIVTVLGILFLLYVTFMPLIALEMWHVQQGGKPFYERAVDSIKEGFDKTINRGKYNKYLDEYIKERFGNAVVEKLKIVNNDSYRYTIKFDSIMDSKFTVYTNTKTGKCGDTLNAVISTDKKFLHLYSEWVKKQVGIEDENVELEFYSNNPIIQFKNINKLDIDYNEIFRETSGFYLSGIKIKNIALLSFSNSKSIAENINIKLANKIIEVIGTPPFRFDYRIALSNGMFNKNDLEIYYRCNYDDINFIRETKW